MRHQITITGVLDTSFSADDVRRDFPMFVDELARVHSAAVQDSITLVSVETLPEPEPATEVTQDIDPTAVNADTAAILAGLNALNARLDRAGL